MILKSLFAIGWIDILNPAGISFVVLLLSIAKKKWHALLFAISAYFAYAIGGIAIFFGVDVFLRDFYNRLCADYPTQTGIAKLIIGIVCLIGCILMVRFLIRSAKSHKRLSMTDMFQFRSVHPAFIAAFAFTSTWSELFSCVPLLTFIGILISQNVSIASASGWLFAYSLFSAVPTVGIYVLSTKVKGERFVKITDKIAMIMTYFCFYCIPVILAIGAWWGIKSGASLFI